MHSCAISEIGALVLLDGVYIQMGWDFVQLLLDVGHYSARARFVMDVCSPNHDGLGQGLLTCAMPELLDCCKLVFLCTRQHRVGVSHWLTARLYKCQVLSK